MASIIVVGAGFCGLSAATELVRAGLDVILIEARDRVGGRVEARPNRLGELVDTGGQFICDDMPEVMRLARGLGKTLTETDFSGDYVVQPDAPYREAERTRIRSTALREGLSRLSPDDASLAGLTVAGWLEQQDEQPDVKAAFRTMIEGLWCIALEDLPAWYLADNDRRVTNTVGELQYSLGQTMQSLAQDMAAGLGRRIRLDTAVNRIERHSAGMLVSTGRGTIDATAVLVATPPVMASRIKYAPALPPKLANALGAWRSGAVIKFVARYERAFWREQGRSGMVMWREPAGLFAFDASPDANHPTLAFFVGGPLAIEWSRLGEQEICERAKARLAAALGAQAGDTIDLTVRNWTRDRWSGGGYSDVIVDMEARDAEDVIRAGCPPLHFACSEVSPSFPAYIEGAIVAGRNAAARIIAVHGDTAPP